MELSFFPIPFQISQNQYPANSHTPNPPALHPSRNLQNRPSWRFGIQSYILDTIGMVLLPYQL